MGMGWGRVLFRVCSMLARGVVPPMGWECVAQSSMRCAPCWEAREAEEGVKQAISRKGILVVGCYSTDLVEMGTLLSTCTKVV
jgi:hypothetical protein